MDFFNEKVDAVRRATGGGPPEFELPPAPAVLHAFEWFSNCKIVKLKITLLCKTVNDRRNDHTF